MWHHDMTDLLVGIAAFFCLTVFMNETKPEPFLVLMSLFCLLVSLKSFTESC